jgi:putative ABC transport system permease protein
MLELGSIPGIKYAEPYRLVPARFRHRHISYRTSIIGIETGSDLYRPLDENLKPVTLPPEGIALTDHLGKILGIKIGDILTVEVLEGGRPVRHVPVAGLVSQYIGLSGYMDLSALNHLMQEGHAISGVYMAADQSFLPVIYKQLYEMPRVAGTEVRRQALKNFRETMNRQMLLFTFIVTILSATIAFGVVYNSSRISLSERSRELASLRVLGFTKAEISYILLGELGFLTLAAILPGFLIGLGLAAYLIANLQTDLFRVPLVVETRTYAFSATVVLISALISGIIVWRRLDHLDLIAVLKTKE